MKRGEKKLKSKVEIEKSRMRGNEIIKIIRMIM